MNHPTLTLKPAKEYPIKAGHPWIFSNAIEREPRSELGDLVIVESYGGEPLGIGMINPQNSIRVRMITRDATIPIDTDFLSNRLKELDGLKKAYLPTKTSGYRLCHADADGLPGLIVDRYSDALVFQISTAGMERLKDKVIEALQKTFKPVILVERSDLDSRGQEGLTATAPEIHHGTLKGPLLFMEHGIKFVADLMQGQKTGFFLDQRETRQRIRELSKGRRVLNLFAYSGASSVYAALGGATEITTVDTSASALELAKQNLKLNGLNPEDEERFQFMEADVFELFKTKSFKAPYDLIICDPPAFAKSSAGVMRALEAYKSLNQRCLWMLHEGGILVSSSCSGRVSAEDFRNTLRIAAGHTGREARVLDFLGQPFDHTEKLSFPEGRYLKTAILEITRAAKEIV